MPGTRWGLGTPRHRNRPPLYPSCISSDSSPVVCHVQIPPGNIWRLHQRQLCSELCELGEYTGNTRACRGSVFPFHFSFILSFTWLFAGFNERNLSRLHRVSESEMKRLKFRRATVGRERREKRKAGGFHSDPLSIEHYRTEGKTRAIERVRRRHRSERVGPDMWQFFSLEILTSYEYSTG